MGNFSNLEEAKELAWISQAYFDAAIHLCKSMISDDFRRSIHRDRVPLYLFHHGFELIFKTALLAAGVAAPKTHNLLKLQAMCKEYAPEAAYEIPRSIGPDSSGTGDLFPETVDAHFRNLTERYRYASKMQSSEQPYIEVTDPVALLAEMSDVKYKSFPLVIELIYMRTSLDAC